MAKNLYNKDGTLRSCVTRADLVNAFVGDGTHVSVELKSELLSKADSMDGGLEDFVRLLSTLGSADDMAFVASYKDLGTKEGGLKRSGSEVFWNRFDGEQSYESAAKADYTVAEGATDTSEEAWLERTLEARRAVSRLSRPREDSPRRPATRLATFAGEQRRRVRKRVVGADDHGGARAGGAGA